MATANATAKPYQRKRQAPRTSSTNRSSAGFMTCSRASEAAFGHDEHVARLKRQVLLHLAAVDERVEFDPNLLLLPVDAAYDMRAIAGRELAEAADGQQGVENGHSIPVWQRLRMHNLPDDLYLAEHTDRDRDDDVDLRSFD